MANSSSSIRTVIEVSRDGGIYSSDFAHRFVPNKGLKRYWWFLFYWAFNASSSFGFASCFSSFLFVAIVMGFMVVWSVLDTNRRNENNNPIVPRRLPLPFVSAHLQWYSWYPWLKFNIVSGNVISPVLGKDDKTIWKKQNKTSFLPLHVVST